MALTVTYNRTTVRSEFQTNSFETGDQLTPDVLGLSNGGFVAAYNSADNAIRLDFHDASFNPIGTFVLPNEGNILAGGQPSLMQLANGNVLVVWSDHASGDNGIRGRLFTPDGTPVGGEIDFAASGAFFEDPQVAVLAGGGFVISYTHVGDVFVERYDGAGTYQGTTQVVDVHDPSGVQNDSAVAALPDGGFVVTFSNPERIRGVVYNADGSVRDDSITDNLGLWGIESEVAALPNGNFAVVNTAAELYGGVVSTNIWLRIYQPNGNSWAFEDQVNTSSIVDEVDPDVTVLPNGFIVVTWTRPTAYFGGDIYARVFDQNGNPVTINGSDEQFIISSSLVDDAASAVSRLLDGQFITSWQSDGSDGSGGQIRSVVNEITRTAVGDNANDAFFGDELRDIVDGGGGQDWLNGGGGDDLLQGGAESDVINGGDGDDVIFGHTQSNPGGSLAGDTLNGDAGDDVITGSSGNDVIDGGADNDRLFGSAGIDSLMGGLGNDILDGGSGADTLNGGAGNDQFFVDNAGDQTVELAGGGDDIVYASASYVLPGTAAVETLRTVDDAGTSPLNLTGNAFANLIVGNAGANVIDGGSNDDVLIGLAGDDTLIGGIGNDRLVGGGGNDLLIGGINSDTAVYSGARMHYRVDLVENGGIWVVDLRPDSPDGTDTVYEVEIFEFADGASSSATVANDAPVVTSNGGGATANVAVPENATAVTTVVATDPDPGTTLTYAIVGGADAGQFQIDAATGALSFVTAPDFEAPADADADNGYAVQVRASDGSLFDTHTLTVNVTDENETIAGNVASVGDVLWRHDDGAVATANHHLGAVPNNWRIATTGDFDGDGDADILWRHRDGMVVTWEMENGQYLINHNIAFASTGWEIVDAGDFDGDGDADVLWRHRDGAVVTWEMEDGQYVINHNIAFASTGWEIDGLGDFDGDGDADVIWRHRDGAVVTWEMEDGHYVLNHNIAFASPGWQIQGTGDFDGDGDDDILSRHADGAVVTWEMENGAYVSNHNIAFASNSWRIEGTGDFNADGTDDILWRHADGAVVTWEIDGGQLLQAHNYGMVSNAWQIRGTGEFDLA